jgi:flagellar motor switch protein FliG
LCESYRIGDKVRHRNIFNLGKLEGFSRENFKLLCDRIEQELKAMLLLFNNLLDGVEKAADIIYHINRHAHDSIDDGRNYRPDGSSLIRVGDEPLDVR